MYTIEYMYMYMYMYTHMHSSMHTEFTLVIVSISSLSVLSSLVIFSSS
jgi:hypothetical protein